MRHCFPGTRLPLTLLLFAIAGCESEVDGGARTDVADPDTWPDATEAEGRRYSVVRDNEAVRILTAEYGPRDASVMHAHPAHCLVLVDAGAWRIERPDGTVADVRTSAGDFGCESAGVHAPINASARSARVVVIELKEDARPGPDPIDGPSAAAADPDHYTALYENDAVRISRVSYPAWEGGALHAHPAHCIVWVSVDPPSDGPEPGTVECGLAQEHAPQMSGMAIELILIEFLGRAVA